MDNDLHIANAFNDFICEQARVSEPNREIPVLNDSVTSLDTIILTEAEVRDIILFRSTNKAKGLDNISNY